MERILKRAGICGVLGAGVLVSCAAFWISAVVPLEAQIADRRARTPSSQDPTRINPQEQLRRFQTLFPTFDELNDEVQRVHLLAREAGLKVIRAEYRLDRNTAGLSAYRVTLPVTGTYSEIRSFLEALLQKVPAASVDAVRFERKSAAQSELDAQVRLTVFVRPKGASK